MKVHYLLLLRIPRRLMLLSFFFLCLFLTSFTRRLFVSVFTKWRIWVRMFNPSIIMVYVMSISYPLELFFSSSSFICTRIWHLSNGSNLRAVINAQYECLGYNNLRPHQNITTSLCQKINEKLWTEKFTIILHFLKFAKL